MEATFELASKAWATGRLVCQNYTDEDYLDTELTDFTTGQLTECLQTELVNLRIEAGILQISKQSKSKFRFLTKSEIASLLPFDINGDVS